MCLHICMYEYVATYTYVICIFNYTQYLRIFYAVIPSIRSPITDKTRNENENVTFLCQAVGEPIPDISWYFNGVMINVSDNSSKYMMMSISLNITTTKNTLTVYNVTSSDVGTYTCNASNIFESDISFGILTVNSKLLILIVTYSIK